MRLASEGSSIFSYLEYQSYVLKLYLKYLDIFEGALHPQSRSHRKLETANKSCKYLTSLAQSTQGMIYQATY